MSFFSSTFINGASMPQVVLRAGGAAPPPPPLNERYFTQLDGQSKFWRRISPNYGQTTSTTLECLFYGGGSSSEYLVGVGGGDRFFIALNGGSVVFGNGANTGLSPTVVDLTKINHAKLVADGTNVTFYVNGVQITQVAQAWSGLLDNISFGLNGSSAAFYSGILVSARVTTDTRDDVYGLDTNLPYDLADGTTDPLADSTLTFENGEIDGSDRLLVTEKQDGSGFLGADLWPDGVKSIVGNATTTGVDSISINEVGSTLAAVGIDAPVGPIVVSGDCELISGQVDLSVIPGFSGVAVSITESGTFSFDLDSQGAVGFKRAFNSGAVANITNIKVDVRYDYADGAQPADSSYSSAYTQEYGE